MAKRGPQLNSLPKAKLKLHPIQANRKLEIVKEPYYIFPTFSKLKDKIFNHLKSKKMGDFLHIWKLKT